MARPLKAGLDYFPLDVDIFSDDKVRLIRAEFGNVGEIVLIRLLCKIYKNGYFYKWGRDECLLFCDDAGAVIRPEQVEEVVRGCLRRSIFDNRVFEMFSVLTSRGIQRRYITATKERSVIELRQELWLIDKPEDTENRKYVIIPPENEVIPPDNEEKQPGGTQSKGKKSKAKDSKEKGACAPVRYADDPLLNAAILDFIADRKERKKPMTSRAIASLVKELDALASDVPTKIAILEQSIAKGWNGVFQLKNGGNTNGASVNTGAGRQASGGVSENGESRFNFRDFST